MFRFLIQEKHSAIGAALQIDDFKFFTLSN